MLDAGLIVVPGCSLKTKQGFTAEDAEDAEFLEVLSAHAAFIGG